MYSCDSCSMMMKGYETRERAAKKAKELGLSGTHKMKNGMYMPGETHEAYHDAMKKSSMAMASDRPDVDMGMDDQPDFDFPGF